MRTGKRAGHSRKTWDDVKRRYLADLTARTGLEIELDARRSARWAQVEGESIAITASREVRDGLWWLALDERALKGRPVRGALFLCESGDEILDFGLPAGVIAEIAPKLDRDQRDEIKFVIRRVRGRYLLRVPGAPDRDITSARGDTSWISSPAGDAPDGPTAPRSTKPPGAATVFFARAHGGVLEPLDPTDLADGDVVLVRATRVAGAPSNATLRRILAAGGAPGLPADFAERHDVYAHGPSSRAR